MASILNHYKIILMIAVLIAVPILLSVIATQYESCSFIKKGCAHSVPPDYVNLDELPNYLNELVCNDSSPTAGEPVYKDLNTGKCYGFGPPSPMPPNPRLVWIGKGEDPRKKSNQDYKAFEVSGKLAWQDTGLVVAKEDLIEISASGIITFASGRTADPDGEINPAEEFYAVHNSLGLCRFLICKENLNSRTLVGRIGTPDIRDYDNGFNIGFHSIITADKSGRLFLGFNDDLINVDRTGLDEGGVSDNSGEFDAVIVVKRKV